MRLRDSSAGTRSFGSGDLSVAFEQDLDALSPGQLDEVEERQRETGRSYSQTAVELGFLEPEALDSGSERRKTGFQALFRSRNPNPIQNPRGAAGRYARELRSILSNFAKGNSVQRNPQKMVVTGVDTSEGASSVARDLAATCASSGFRVLLVDTNLDRPTVHRHFGLSNEAGLSDLLSSADSPHRLPQATPLPNLAVIAAGPRPRNYSSLLARERMFHRLEPISGYFDYIIADAGSLTPSLVGRIGAGADNIIVTVKEHVSSMRDLERMLRTVQAEAVPDPAVLMIE